MVVKTLVSVQLNPGGGWLGNLSFRPRVTAMLWHSTSTENLKLHFISHSCVAIKSCTLDFLLQVQAKVAQCKESQRGHQRLTAELGRLALGPQPIAGEAWRPQC